jgi:hypothetical protein
MYNINGYRLFRNDTSQFSGPGRPYGGTAAYSRIPLKEGYPHSHNISGIEFTIIKTESHQNLTIIGLYRSPVLRYHAYFLLFVLFLMKIPLHKT